ncbi:MAG: serine/threonine-protein kinase [Acidobacteriota bacterium]
MREALHRLWLEVRWSSWFQELPEWLHDPPGVFLLLLPALGAFWTLGWLAFGRERRTPDGARASRDATRRDLAAMRQAGNHLGLGEHHEAVGEFTKALRAYRRGGHAREEAVLLRRLGRDREALSVARASGQWRIVGEIAAERGDERDSAGAFERAGDLYLAARAWDRAEEPLAAARCYVAAGAEGEAIARLVRLDASVDAAARRERVDLLDRALRAGLAQGGASALSLDAAGAVERGVQLWLEEGEPRRAGKLAIDCGRPDLAVPVLRDHVEPSLESAEICARAGAHLAAAELYDRLERPRQASLERAEHHLRRNEAAQAAGFFDAAGEPAQAAEQWAAAGELERAAERFEHIGDAETARRLRQEVEGSGAAAGVGASPSQLPTLGPPRRDDAPDSIPDFGLDLTAALEEQALEAGAPVSGGAARATRGVEPTDERRYRLLGELGRGGMGIVYRAEDRVLERQVAYKVLPERLSTGLEVEPEVLLAEARAAARLSHPNIVQVYDAGRRDDADGGGFFVVMELVRGDNLETLLRQRAMSVRGAVQVAQQIAAALAHAHARQLIHRDLKPSNLLWSDERRIKLTDFGLAKVFQPSLGKVVTRPAGTPSYMAPEQILGEGVDPRTDLYAFGCVLFEMLCRRPVFASGPPGLYHHLHSPPPDPRDLRPEIPDEISALILDCLKKEAAQRPESIRDIQAQLSAASLG